MFKSFRFSGLTGGLYASANIFDQPQGTLPFISNIVFTRRGGLQTVDGSHQVVIPNSGTNPGPYAPIVAMAQYNPAGVTGIVPHLFGMTLDASGNATIIDLSAALWSGVFGGPYPSAGPTLGAVQFSNSMVFALGLNVIPLLYDPIQTNTIQPIANTFQPTTNYPPWLATTVYARGDKVIAAPSGSSTSYIWVAQNPGTSGSPTPTWTAGVGDVVTDNSITWKNKGAASAEGPPGAAFVFNHLNSLWVWGTSPTYSNNGPNAGLDGPDSLRMSDSGNPTSFDPSNQSFIGQGDGQAAAGGGVWTQLEVGIPATAQLILFKTKSTYSVIGAFPAITIQEIPDGVGCVAPNTIQFVPGIGLMRLSLFGPAVFNGTRDQTDQYTDPIRPYLFGTQSEEIATDEIIPVDWNYIANSVSAQTVNPPGYLMLVPTIGSNGVLTRAFFFDRLLKAWTVIDFPDSMKLSGALFNFAKANDSQTLVSGYSDGIVRQIFAGDEQWDTEQVSGTLIQWHLAYPAVGSPGTAMYFRRGIFRGMQLGQLANLRSAHVHIQDRNGLQLNQVITPLAIDATQLTQAIDIDQTDLGGLVLHVFGQGRMLCQGMEVQYLPKPLSRIPG